VSIYDQIGVRPIINATGSVTRLGGAPMPPEVLRAYVEAASLVVPLDQLQGAASRIIAEVTGAEAGLVTSGAAAALTLGTASILTGFDIGRMERLPRCDGIPHEFVVAREQRNGYDHAVRAAGAVLVEVGFNELVANAGVRRTEVREYEVAFGAQTAGILYVQSPNSRPLLKDVVTIAHQHRLPVIVDAAAELPPRRNLRDLIATGADLVAFSGGKAIRGPQGTGILCGRRDLVGAASMQMLDMDDHPELWQPSAELIDLNRIDGMPRHGIGRGFKVSKEQIAALLTALRMFEAGAYEPIVAGYRPRLDRLAMALNGLPARCVVEQRGDGESFPILVLTLDEAAIGRSAWEVCRRLRAGNPPIYVGHSRLAEARLVVHPLHLDDATIEVLAIRLREELSP
jgi:D-glucosaminate-6-phosphate ammonia-lyase